jgi:hypothetical protein
MPTSLRIGPYRFFFYSSDQDEPPHVHIKRDNRTAKFWLEPVRLQRSGRFGPREINEIQRMVVENQELLLREWHEYFGT